MLCPVLSIILQNTYGGTSDLYVSGEILALNEGTTQGDPLAMSMYTVGIMPLIHELQPTGTKQVWFADDATGGGTLKEVMLHWIVLALGIVPLSYSASVPLGYHLYSHPAPQCPTCTGGYPFICHNELCDITADLLKEV